MESMNNKAGVKSVIYSVGKKDGSNYVNVVAFDGEDAAKEYAAKLIADLVADPTEYVVTELSDGGLSIVGGPGTKYTVHMMELGKNQALDRDVRSYYYHYDETYAVEVMDNKKTGEYLTYFVDKNLPKFKFLVQTRKKTDALTPELVFIDILPDIQFLVDRVDA